MCVCLFVCLFVLFWFLVLVLVLVLLASIVGRSFVQFHVSSTDGNNSVFRPQVLGSCKDVDVTKPEFQKASAVRRVANVWPTSRCDESSECATARQHKWGSLLPTREGTDGGEPTTP